MVAAIAFYAFATILIGAAVLVVIARNPVHAVLFLILAFLNAAALFVMAGAEFLAMVLAIVYVGAVAVLFLFVVMMLDIEFAQLREGFQRYAPLGAALGVVLLVELLLLMAAGQVAPAGQGRAYPIPEGLSNTAALGRILYTDHILLFQLAGLILLVAMVGAIVLTLRKRPGIRRQDIAVQISRKGSVTLRDVPVGVGLKEIGVMRPLLTVPGEAAKAPELAHDREKEH